MLSHGSQSLCISRLLKLTRDKWLQLDWHIGLCIYPMYKNQYIWVVGSKHPICRNLPQTIPDNSLPETLAGITAAKLNLYKSNIMTRKFISKAHTDCLSHFITHYSEQLHAAKQKHLDMLKKLHTFNTFAVRVVYCCSFALRLHVKIPENGTTYVTIPPLQTQHTL